MRAAIGWVCAARWRQALLLVLVCCAVFLPGLGSTGFSQSEGHRVVPALEMLEDARAGDPHWLVPRMFGTDYLRKPPGTLWAIALSSAALGETEFAARLPSAVSATLLALAVWWFASRWFGSPWGLAAGLAQALLPVTWPSARSAEIESLHMLATGGACLLLLDWAVRPPGRSAGHWARAGALLVAILAMLLTKGPSGAPFLAGTLAGAAVFGRGRLPRGAAAPLLVALGAGAALGYLLTHSATAGPAVTQGVGEFLWERERLLQIILISPTILVSMLPASLALLFPLGGDARAEREAEGAGGPGSVARALLLAVLASLLVFEVAGVSNPRYGLPLCALVTPLVAYVARLAWSGASPAVFASAGRRTSARLAFLFHPLAAPAIALFGAGVYVGLMEQRDSSGRAPGGALAPHLPDGAEVWADEVIEARPELLLYALRDTAAAGKRVRVRWIKPEFMPAERPEGLLLLLREDELEDEVSLYLEEGYFGSFTERYRGGVHDYTFVLVEPGPG